MKKKQILLIAGIAAAVILAAVLIFVLVGGGNEGPQPLLHGTWKVIVEVQDEKTKYPENGFFVFTAEKATEYRDGESSAFVVSDYTFTESETDMPVLEMPAFEQVYRVEIITDNYIRLYLSGTYYKTLIRYADADRKELKVNSNTIEGGWDVIYRDGETVDWKLKMVFSSTIVIHNLETENSNLVDDFYWNKDGNICIDAMGLQLKPYPLSEDVLLLVDVKTDEVWELHGTVHED